MFSFICIVFPLCVRFSFIFTVFRLCLLFCLLFLLFSLVFMVFHLFLRFCLYLYDFLLFLMFFIYFYGVSFTFIIFPVFFSFSFSFTPKLPGRGLGRGPRDANDRDQAGELRSAPNTLRNINMFLYLYMYFYCFFIYFYWFLIFCLTLSMFFQKQIVAEEPPANSTTTKTLKIAIIIDDLGHKYTEGLEAINLDILSSSCTTFYSTWQTFDRGRVGRRRSDIHFIPGAWSSSRDFSGDPDPCRCCRTSGRTSVLEIQPNKQSRSSDIPEHDCR